MAGLRQVYTALKNHAAGDAAHDFNGARGDFNFKSFFARYHLIGTPGTPDEIKHEYQLLNEFLQLTAEPSEAACERAFGEAYVQEGADHVVQRFAEDPIPYRVSAKRVAVGSDGTREWKITSTELYAFLNGGSASDLAFTIDAANIPVAEGLTREKGGSKLKAYYVLPREGIIDGALKANKSLESRDDDTVQITKKHDNDPSIVAYPATDIARLETLHHTELFFSQYPIHIQPVRQINGVRATSIDFTNRIMTGQKDKFKSMKEDSNPYTVNKLSKLLSYFSSIIAGSTGVSTQERDYHMCLQFKRAGDWLQALSCLSPERFGLATTTRIRLITHDRLCLLYGLKMGVDVAFTMIHNTPEGAVESWIITFYKDTAELSPVEQLLSHLPTLVNPEDPILPDKPGNYIDCRAEYIESYDKTYERLQNKFREVFKSKSDSIGKLDTDIQIEQSIHDILKAAMRIAVFRTKCPLIRSEEEEQIYTFLRSYTGDELTRRELSEYQARLKKYISQRQALVSAANVKQHRSESTTAQIAIAAYFKAMFRDEPASLKERYRMIEKLSFRARLFHWDNFNENGTGIFTYLNGGLDDYEKIAIIEYMSSVQRRVSRVSTEKYTTFLKLARFLQQTRAAQPPTAREIPTEDILRSMFTMPPAGAAEEDRPSLNFAINIVKHETREPTSPEEAASIAAADETAKAKGGSIIEISDFFAEQAVLAARAQGSMRDVVSAISAVESLRGANIDERNVIAGGGADRFNHNPLTTLCVTLWEINSALMCEHADLFLLYTLSRIVEHILTEKVKAVRQMTSVEDIYEYLHSLELFILEGIDREFPNRSFNHFMAGIKEEYFGFTAVNNYKRDMHLTRKEIDELVRLRPKHSSIGELMALNMDLLENALTYVGAIEKLALGQQVNVRSGSSVRARNTRRRARNSTRRINKLVVAYGGSRRRRR